MSVSGPCSRLRFPGCTAAYRHGHRGPHHPQVISCHLQLRTSVSCLQRIFKPSFQFVFITVHFDLCSCLCLCSLCSGTNSFMLENSHICTHLHIHSMTQKRKGCWGIFFSRYNVSDPGN